jgi:hypothetical protein
MMQRARKWTPARIALARRLYPDQRVPLAYILAQINALPGARIVCIEAMKAGIHHNCGPLPRRAIRATAPSSSAARQAARWTPERIALAEAIYPDGSIPLETILARLNELPGLPIPTVNALTRGVNHHCRRLPRRVAPKPPQPARERKPRGIPAAETWTPERIALARQIYPIVALPLADILMQLNALPGLPIRGIAQMQQGIYRRCKPVAPRGRPDPYAAADPLAAIPPEDLAEAREMIRSRKHDANSLADWFGWPPDQAKAVAAALRDEQTAPNLTRRAA